MVSPTGLGWMPAAVAVLDRAFEHFGGVDAWRRIRLIRVFGLRMSGLLPLLKGMGHTYVLPDVVEIYAYERRTRFLDYPAKGSTGVYDNGSVRIEVASTGEVLEASTNHRSTFARLTRNRRWSPLDALYFFGYALNHYHSLPFELAGARLLDLRVSGAGGVIVDRLEVEFPPEVTTHSRRESFYFDGDGWLVRHDYVADIIGGWARGAHLWKRQTRVGGFPIAMERQVVARIGTAVSPVTVLHSTFDHVVVELAPEAPGRAPIIASSR
jgi:hypothetical protein